MKIEISRTVTYRIPYTIKNFIDIALYHKKPYHFSITKILICAKIQNSKVDDVNKVSDCKCNIFTKALVIYFYKSFVNVLNKGNSDIMTMSKLFTWRYFR